MVNSDNRWYKLDNAAKIYPAVTSPKTPSVFRLSASLTFMINPEKLEEALFVTLKRFPSFAVSLKSGVFWYYFDANHKRPRVRIENEYPCSMIDRLYNDGFLFRVTYFGSKINLECFHSLTDGTGALVFLKALTFNYLRIEDKQLNESIELFSESRGLLAKESEDCFAKYFESGKKIKEKEVQAYHLKGYRSELRNVYVTHGSMSADILKKVARDSGSTITEYVAALLLYSIYRSPFVHNYEALKKNPLKVSVPVNLRNFFNTDTLRNFSMFVNLSAETSGYNTSFEQVLDNVRRQMREQLDKELLFGRFCYNVSAERNRFFKFVPLFIKNIALRIAYKRMGDKLFTCTLSNLGKIELPADMQAYVERFLFVLAPTPTQAINCAIATLGDELTISFSRLIEGSDVERFFFNALCDAGITITVRSN